MRKVIFKGIPRDYTPQKYLLFSIANFQGNEDKYQQLKDEIAINSTTTVADNIEIGKRTSNYALGMLSTYADKLNKFYHTSYSVDFWSIILYPWLVTAIQLMYDRQVMVINFIRKFENERLHIELLDDKLEISISDTSSLQGTIQHNPIFNHWLLSRIFEDNCPSNWKLSYLPTESYRIGKTTLTKRPLKQQLDQAYRKFELFINTNVSRIYGTNLFERLLLSLLVKVKPPIKSYHGRVLKKRSDLDNINWIFDHKKILNRLFPESKLKLDLSLKKKHTRGKLQIYSNDLYYNNKSKIKAAKHRYFGGLIIPVQHGGYVYGIGYVNEVINKIEVEQDYFISWGWSSKSQPNVIPLPSPLLSKMLDKHKPKINRIVLVSSIANFYGSRYNSWLPPDLIFQYREERESFIKALKGEPKSQLWYKPYPSKVHSLTDALFFFEKYPALRRIKTYLKKEMLSCRLLVLDHPGTTLALAMAANTPTVIFFRKAHFDQIGAARELFKSFKEVGIYHSTADSAADFINKNYLKTQEWWNSTQVQSVRMEFMHRYARAEKAWFSTWLKTIWKLDATS